MQRESSYLSRLLCMLVSMALASYLSGCEEQSAETSVSFSVVSDEASLEQRFVSRDEKLSVDSEAAMLTVGEAPSLRLVAEILPPKLGELTLQATSMDMRGSHLFIGYNLQGARQAGAVDMVFVPQPRNPRLTSQLMTPFLGINGVSEGRGGVYLTGAVDETQAQASMNSFLAKIDVRGHVFGSRFTMITLDGFSGTEVKVHGDRGYLTWGDNGGVMAFDPDNLRSQWSADVYDARSVVNTDKQHVTVLAGQPARLLGFDRDGVKLSENIVGGAETAESKANMVRGEHVTVVSIGEQGWKLLCNKDGGPISHFDAIELDDIDPSVTVTNAVAAHGNLIFAANGEAGLYVYHLHGPKDQSDCSGYKVSYVGSVNFGRKISANSVYSAKDHFFVASGLGGVKIVSVDHKDSNSGTNDFGWNP